MPFSGGVFTATDGVYNSPNLWQQEAAAGIDILALNFDTFLNDLITNGLNLCLLKDGSQVVTANIPFAGFQITNLGAGVAQNSAATVAQAQGQAPVWCGTAGGSANAITLTPSPAITAYAAGQTWRFTAFATNAASTTYAVSGLATPRTVQKNLGGGLKNLAGGEILIGGLYEITDNGTVGILQQVPEGTQGATIASAATNDLSTATGDYVQLSGAATITSLGTLPAGARRTTETQGACVFTNNANIIVSGGANRTAAAGDVYTWRSEGAGVWRMESYALASGQSIVVPLPVPAYTIKTATFVAAAGGKYIADCSNGAFTATMPTTPANTDAPITIKKEGVNSLTVDFGGKSVRLPGGSVVSGTVTIDGYQNGDFMFAYIGTNAAGTTNLWVF